VGSGPARGRDAFHTSLFAVCVSHRTLSKTDAPTHRNKNIRRVLLNVVYR
jgi:hypothetical protein